MQVNNIDIPKIAKNLTMLETGVWASTDVSNISYPDEGYSNSYQLEDESFWFKNRNNCIIEVIKRYPPSGTIFDIGGGNGFVTLGLKNGGYDAILVEPGIIGIRNAVSRGIYPVIYSTLEEAGFYDCSMPAVGLFDVLEHINDDIVFLRKLNSYIVPDGRLYATVPAYNALWSTEDDFAGHYRRYTLKEFENKLKIAGFEVEYKTYFFTLLILPIYLFRTIPSKFSLRKTNELSRHQKEHNIRIRPINILMQMYFDLELQLIKKDKIPLGASCLIVARKTNK